MSGKVFRVNMSNLSVSIEKFPAKWEGLGGRGLTSTIVAQEVPPTCHPLGEHNKLVFAPGLLTGTPAANSGRMSAGAKSPLTGAIKESNVGGTAGQMYARLGIRAVIIEGQPAGDGFYSLHISKEGVSIAEETELVGQGNFAVIETLMERMGKRIGVISIGTAGEMKMAAANISVRDAEGKIRSHGRGGLGAVMGAKKIKYITLDTTDASEVKIADPDQFRTASRAFAKSLLGHPVSGEGLPNFGTNVLVNVINEAGGLPTRNFRSGQCEGHDKFSGETMREIILERGGKPRHGCHPGCIIQCSQVYPDKDGKYLTSGFEYETIWGFGAHSGVEDLDLIALADNLMDDIGIDSIETAVAVGVAMDGGALSFGDGAAALRLIREIGEGTPLGRIVGNGAASVGKAYGVTRVPVVKGQAIPAYDPRAIKGIGITYCTTPMGADHTAGYAVASNIMGVGGLVDPLSKEGQVELSRSLQMMTAAIDSTGLCLFVAMALADDPEAMPALVTMLNARYGEALTAEDVVSLGKNILLTEREFNLAAGFTNKDDRLPEFFSEPIPPHNAVWDFSGDEIDQFWNF